MRRFGFFVLLLVTAGAFADAAPRLVVVYVPCTVSAKYLDPYGGPALTPQLARFAENAAVFTAHRTEANGSGPAFASIFTGQQADGHGVFTHPAEVAEPVDDLSEVLRAAGYTIFYWDTHRMADHDLGYLQAAQHVTDSLPYPNGPDVSAVLDRLVEDPDAKLAIFAAFSVTHSPYDPAVYDLFKMTHRYHPLAKIDRATFDRLYDLYVHHTIPFSVRYDDTVAELGLTSEDEARLAEILDGLYSANIDRLDALFGGLLAEIGQRNLRDDALIVFTADHGESMNEPDAPVRWNHAASLRTEVLTVPFVVAGPGVVPARHTFVTRSIDVAPTVAGLIGLEGSPQWQGVDLSPVLRGQAKPPRLRAFSRRAGVSAGAEPGDEYFPNTWAAVRDGDLVLKYRTFDGAPAYRMYNLADDPDESRDILDMTDPRHAELVHALKCYRVKLWNAYLAKQEATAIPEDAEEVLRSMGYIE